MKIKNTRAKNVCREITDHPSDPTKLMYTLSNCKYPCTFIFDKDALPIISIYNWTPIFRYGKIHGFTAKSATILLAKYIMDCEDDETVLPIDGDKFNMCRDNLVVLPKNTKSICAFKRFIPNKGLNHPAVKLEKVITAGIVYEYVVVRFTNYIIFKRTFSLEQYSLKRAYQLANELATKIHEDFLRSTPLQGVVNKINKQKIYNFG